MASNSADRVDPYRTARQATSWSGGEIRAAPAMPRWLLWTPERTRSSVGQAATRLLMQGSGERTNDAVPVVIQSGVRGDSMHGTTQTTNDGPESGLGRVAQGRRWFLHHWEYSTAARLPKA